MCSLDLLVLLYQDKRTEHNIVKTKLLFIIMCARGPAKVRTANFLREAGQARAQRKFEVGFAGVFFFGSFLLDKQKK
jgi:hypothetical protein